MKGRNLQKKKSEEEIPESKPLKKLNPAANQK